MSNIQFPPQGTKCVDCGCCQANIYAGNDLLCWACDSGSHGAKKQPPTSVVNVSPRREEVPAREEKRAVVETPPAAPKVEPAKPAPSPLSMEELMPRGRTYQRAGAVPCAVEGCENNAYSPRKYCTRKHFYYNQHPPGVKAVAQTGGRKPVEKRNLKVAAPAPASAIVPAAGDKLAVPSGRVISIQGEITPTGADTFWNLLSLDQKAQIIQASLRSILERKEA